MKTPAVILFGSTSPIGSGYEGNENLWYGKECSPCYKEYEWARDPNGPCPYDRRCMKEITVEMVLSKISNYLNARNMGIQFSFSAAGDAVINDAESF